MTQCLLLDGTERQAESPKNSANVGDDILKPGIEDEITELEADRAHDALQGRNDMAEAVADLDHDVIAGRCDQLAAEVRRLRLDPTEVNLLQNILIDRTGLQNFNFVHNTIR